MNRTDLTNTRTPSEPTSPAGPTPSGHGGTAPTRQTVESPPRDFEGPLIHLGYHKTATSWLQRDVFSNPDVGLVQPWESPTIIESFVIPLSHDFNPESVHSVFSPGLADARRRGMLPILSQETLSGEPMHGKVYGCEVADRLHAVFPDAKILVVIREQRDLLFSLYCQYIRSHGRETVEEFVGMPSMPCGYRPICRREAFEYDRLIERCQDLWGDERVLVLLYEHLRRDPRQFLDRLGSFVGRAIDIDPTSTTRNRRFGGVTLEMRRRMNHIFRRRMTHWAQTHGYWLMRRWCDRLDAVIPDFLHSRFEKRIKDHIYGVVGDAYSASNRRTSSLIGVDLSAHGYA